MTKSCSLEAGDGVSNMTVRFPTVFLVFLSMGGSIYGQAPGVPAAPANDPGRQVRWQSLAANIGSDQKRIWLFPTKVVRGRHVWPTLAVVGVTAALILTDAQTAPHFRDTTVFHGFNSVFTSNATDMGVLTAPVLLYAAVCFEKNHAPRHTAILAGEAVADAEILTVLGKE